MNANRPLCQYCQQRPRAVAYVRSDGSRQYRRRCEACIRRRRGLKPSMPKWQVEGYKKKPACELCGFVARYSAQLLVYHIDGNLNNVQLRNLKTVCQNCSIEIKFRDLPWTSSDLRPDF